jgi:hypothetical protein
MSLFYATTNVFSKYTSMLSLRLKGKWSTRRRQGFHSTLQVSFILHCYPALQIGTILHTYLFVPIGRKFFKGSQSLRFLVINAKGGESISPKQKDRTTTFRKILIDIFQIGMLIYIFKTSISMYFQLISIKTLLKAKRRISFRGSFV